MRSSERALHGNESEGMAPHVPARAVNEPAPPPALAVGGVTAGYRYQPIIFDVSANVYESRVTAIIGPNGAGKSTLFKALFGAAVVFSGTVRIDGREAAISPRELVHQGIAYVPQTRNVFPSLTVRENLEMGTFVRGRRGYDLVFGLFPDLAAAQKTRAGHLSGGQRNMLAVGRALMSDPRVLLLDEATGGLSPLVAQNLWRHVTDLARNGIAIGAIEQNVHAALEAADYVYVLAGGRNLISGSPTELKARPDFVRMFLEGTDHAPTVGETQSPGDQ